MKGPRGFGLAPAGVTKSCTRVPGSLILYARGTLSQVYLHVQLLRRGRQNPVPIFFELVSPLAFGLSSP